MVKAAPSLPGTVSYPKLTRGSPGYRYYPGYSRSFVRDILAEWPRADLVLDPWNGSGTTTAVAAELGLECIGVDLNPAMVVIAKAALLNDDDVTAIRRQAYAVRDIEHGTTPIDDGDPLLEWLDRASVARVRAMQEALVGSTHLDARDVADLGAAEAFWLTALFQTLRRATRAWHTSNPTWIKRRRGGEAAGLSSHDIVSDMHTAAGGAAAVRVGERVTARAMVGDSARLGEYGFTPDLVLGSPPYCTRIDYAVATRVELSVLGLTAVEQSALRRRLMGTTTVPRVETVLGDHASPAVRRTLEAVREHPSKASGTYYAKWLAQYFAAYSASLAGVARTTARGGTVGLVVQGSYYKEIEIDLPKITVEILGGLGWLLVRGYDFKARRSLAQINPRAVAYREGAAPTERALFFRSE